MKSRWNPNPLRVLRVPQNDPEHDEKIRSLLEGIGLASYVLPPGVMTFLMPQTFRLLRPRTALGFGFVRFAV